MLNVISGFGEQRTTHYMFQSPASAGYGQGITAVILKQTAPNFNKLKNSPHRLPFFAFQVAILITTTNPGNANETTQIPRA